MTAETECNKVGGSKGASVSEVTYNATNIPGFTPSIAHGRTNAQESYVTIPILDLSESSEAAKIQSEDRRVEV